jgi:peptide/nickel transport system substrate-binding protein
VRRSGVMKLAALAALTATMCVVVAGAGGATTKGSATAGTLVVLESDIPNGLDIDGNATGQVVTAEIMANLYDTQVFYPITGTNNGFLMPNYKVAQQGYVPWQVNIKRQSPKSWLVTVKQGIKSCAGNEMTADDVMWSLQRAKSATGTTNFSWFQGYAANIWGVEPVLPNATAKDKTLTDAEARKTGKYTVVINQKTPNVLFPRLWTTFEFPIFDTTEVKKHATESDPWAHQWVETQGAAGFGPYCLDSWTKGSQMTLTANPNYFLGQPEFKTIIIKKIPAEANRVAAIQSGAADIVKDLTPQAYDKLARDGKVTVPGYYNAAVTSLIFGFNFDPWKGDKQKSMLLRQAFAYAMPYQQIAKQAYYGNAKQWYSQVFSAANGYVENKKYSTNVAKAKALLKQAGYPDGKGLEKFGDGLSLFYPAERASIVEPVATAIRTALGNIGVPITLHPIPIVDFQQRQLSKHDMGLALYDFGTPYGADMSYAYNLFFLTPAAGGPLNTGAFSNKTTDQLFVKSLSTVGEPRRELLRRMQQILMTDLPQVPLVEWKTQMAVRKGLQCFVGHPDTGIRFWLVSSKGCKSNLLKK